MGKNQKKDMSVGVVIVTHNAEKHIQLCLRHILDSGVNPKIVVIDSSSEDSTVEIAKKNNIDVQSIQKENFNHGLTRETGRKILNTDIVTMITQDSYLLDKDTLEILVEPIKNGSAAISYARQIPHDSANFFEAFPRFFNYPDESQIRSINDLKQYGLSTFFSSNSCCAYLNTALEEIGGFKNVLMGEDTLAAYEILRKGYNISYTADAIVKHSHRYSIVQEFRRYFDTGYYRRQFKDLFEVQGADEGRGKAYAISLLKLLARKSPQLLPYACLHVLAKWLGYKIGQKSLKMPEWFKRLISSQDFYWTSV